MTAYKPKLIEVALPLAAINENSAREKSIRHGHPSTLHLWWARRPLAAARAVLWASLVDDPSADESLTPEQQDAERARLFGILERLVVWENLNDVGLLAEAKAEIDRCFDGEVPPILDPFGGGGAIPLEAQRLGLKALSGDLNPVAVLIQKAMIEVPPRFAGRPPVNPHVDAKLKTWDRAQGLAADVAAYGEWMRDIAKERIGQLYPDATGPNGEKLTPIAWIWARTVESPDPSWSGHVPLVASWTLANRAGRPKVWIEPVIDRDSQTISYKIHTGGEPSRERTVDRGNGTCIATGAAIPYAYVRAESLSGRMGFHLMAVVAEGEAGRSYCEPNPADLRFADLMPDVIDKPTSKIGNHPRNISPPPFGLDEWWKLFTPRQLVALTTFSDLLKEVHARVETDARNASWSSDPKRLRDGGGGTTAYADAVVTYLAFAIDKCADYWSSICTWHSSGEKMRNTFGRQAIPMSWDFAECNPFSDSSGNWMAMVTWVRKAIEHLPTSVEGAVVQRDARARVAEAHGSVISTDPPYYDNISYADLSDFFFVWLRRNLGEVWPDECATLLTPKSQELIANRYRAGSREAAEKHFESGMAELTADVAKAQAPGVPATIYYAYKATETQNGEVRSTGWDKFLQGVLDARLQVTATWPLRTEMSNRIIASGTNALASSIVLVCRPREVTASLATRGEFIASLRAELPEAIRLLQSGSIPAIDLPQSTIGPGIKLFSRYAKVVEANGSSMPVADALAIINDVLAEVIDGEEGELDADSRFALSWYAANGFNPNNWGHADSQARAKNTSIGGIEEAGIGEARAGTFRLFERSELDLEWSPSGDKRLTVWEATQHLVLALERSESQAAALLHQLGGGFGDRARNLAYVLFKKATDKGWASEAAAYNALIVAWPNLHHTPTTPAGQGQML